MAETGAFENLDPYTILGVERTATASDLKSACTPSLLLSEHTWLHLIVWLETFTGLRCCCCTAMRKLPQLLCCAGM